MKRLAAALPWPGALSYDSRMNLLTHVQNLIHAACGLVPVNRQRELLTTLLSQTLAMLAIVAGPDAARRELRELLLKVPPRI